jgi:hypothetical protein
VLQRLQRKQRSWNSLPTASTVTPMARNETRKGERSRMYNTNRSDLQEEDRKIRTWGAETSPHRKGVSSLRIPRAFVSLLRSASLRLVQ